MPKMVATVTVDLSEINKLLVDLDVLELQLEQEIIDESIRTVQDGRDLAKEKVPVFHGVLSDSIKLIPPRVDLDAEGFLLITGIDAGQGLGDYPSVMEYGRTAGSTPPPIWAMEAYIRERLAQGRFDVSGYGESDPIRRAAFALSRSIGKFGILGIEYMSAGASLIFNEIVPRLELVLEMWTQRYEVGVK